jgi:hypothetical protein
METSMRSLVRSLVFLFIYSGSTYAAIACVELDANTGRMFNNCGYKVIVDFKTVGGGCFTGLHGTEVIQAGGWTGTALSMSCGSSGGWQNFWAWCPYEDWVNGTCKPYAQ